MNKKYTIEDFESTLSSVILPEDEVVLVFSGLWAFVKFLDIPIRDSAQIILDSILKVMTDKRTLVMPAYNWSFCSTGIFNTNTIPSKTGILTELFRKKSGVERTLSPIDSHCVIGPRAKELLSIKNVTLWGHQSEFGWLEKVNARMVRMGARGWQDLGYLHRIEEEGRVPYRYFKTFKGIWTDGKLTREIEETMYVRHLEVEVENVWHNWEQEMRKGGLILKPALTVFKIESALAQDVIRVGLGLVREDPYCFVKNKEAVRRWVESRRGEYPR